MSFWDRLARSHHQSSDSEEDFVRPLRRRSQSGTSRFCPEKFTVYVVLACLFYGASLPVLGQSEKKPWCNFVLLRSLVSVWSDCFHLFTSSFVPFRIKGNPASRGSEQIEDCKLIGMLESSQHPHTFRVWIDSTYPSKKLIITYRFTFSKTTFQKETAEYGLSIRRRGDAWPNAVLMVNLQFPSVTTHSSELGLCLIAA